MEEMLMHRIGRCCVFPSVVIGTLLLPPSPAFPQDRVTIQDVERAWRQRSERVRTFRIEWDEKYTVTKDTYHTPPSYPEDTTFPPETRAYDLSFKLIMDGNRKIRAYWQHVVMVKSMELVPQEHIWTTTGSGYRSLRPPGTQDYPRGVITTEKAHVHGMYINDPNFFPVVWHFRPFGALSTGFDDLAKHYRVLPGREEVVSRTCVVMHGVVRSRTRKFWLDPARGFLVMQYQNIRDDGTVSRELTFESYEHAATGWVPVKWKKTDLARDGSVSTSNAATVGQYAINQPIDPATFELEFPPGTWVKDARTDTEYILRENGGKRIIQPHEDVAAVSYDDLLHTESGEALPGRASEGWSTATMLLLLAVLGALGLTLLWFWRWNPAKT